MRGGRYELHTATMVDLIGIAYSVDADKVIGGPSWLDTDRFDVIAKGPVNTTPRSLQSMLQALLADRFKLVIHNDTKSLPAYALTAGRHPQLKEASGGGDGGGRPAPRGAQGNAPGALPNVTVSCHNTTMSEFANRLPQLAGDYLQGNPVTDLTGLKGAWDFTVTWTGRNALLSAGADGISICDAVGKELGLKLDVQRVPVPVVAVDRVNENPTDNLPGVALSLPPIPTEFEVAVIKPSMPGSPQRSFRLEPGGRIDLRAFTLKELIKFAWNFQDLDVIDNDDMLVGAPKWSEAERFDIIAQATPAIDIDSVHLMFRRLLEDRFKLAAHTADQPVPVYALVAAKPKLKKADSSNRPGCRNSLVAPGIALKSAPLFSVTCHNTTMAQLAEKLQNMGGIYISHPVIDSTGIEGAWDFVLSWYPPHLLQGCSGCGREAGLAAAAAGAGAGPNGSLTLVEALDRQLGLRLKPQKHAMPVLVIDHLEQQPTDN
jgi:uncharacterized protein (TIGR03435 family)